jgi:hypothetical protein
VEWLHVPDIHMCQWWNLRQHYPCLRLKSPRTKIPWETNVVEDRRKKPLSFKSTFMLHLSHILRGFSLYKWADLQAVDEWYRSVMPQW